MAGIRVSYLSNKCTEKELKIHFTKPQNGGGPIKALYYPLFDNDAVVIFEDPTTLETVTAHKHILMEEEVDVTPLHSPQIYTEMEAKLDPSVAAFLQATEEVRDELQYHRNVEFCCDRNRNIFGVRGNWYLLEWVWAYIERITKRQSQTRDFQYQNTPSFQAENQLRSPSPGELNDPKIGVPSAPDSLSSSDDKSFDVVKLLRESPKAKIRRNVSDMTTETDSKRDKTKFDSPVRMEDRRRDSLNDDDNIEKLAHLTLSGNEETATEITILNDKPEDVRSLDFRYGPLTVSVYSGMITMAETEAIVNAAMGCMINAGGVARAIADAAGPEMQRQCDEYVQKYGSVPTAQVIHTCAGGNISLNVKYVIHAVGPIWSSERERECTSQLTQTFLNCMTYGNDVLKIQSISMPVISSGIFGCPLELCVESFLNAVLLFSYEHISDAVHLKEVNLVNNNSDNTAMTVLHLRQLFSRGTQRLVQEAQQQIKQTGEVDYRAGNTGGLRLNLDYGTDFTSGGSTTRFGATSTLMGDKTSPLTSGVHVSSLLPMTQSASRLETDSRYRNIGTSSYTSAYTSMPFGYSPGSASPKVGLHTDSQSSYNTSSASSGLLGSSSSASVGRDFGGTAASTRDKTGDTTSTSKTRKSGPPTSSYLYDEIGTSGTLGTKTGATSKGIPKTAGRPLPPPPTGASWQAKRY